MSIYKILSMFRGVCVFLAGRPAATGRRVAHKKAALGEAHLLGRQAGQCSREP